MESQTAAKSKTKVLIGASGSVAAIKVHLLCKQLVESGKCIVRLVLTERAAHFVDLSSVPSEVEIFRDADEWSSWTKRSDPVIHVDLRKWADVFVIAPLSANTLAKIANGLCDNLLTCIARAWDFRKKMIVAPAMNTLMFEHPLTGKQLLQLREWDVMVLETVSKVLMCGDVGLGAMAEVDTIVAAVNAEITAQHISRQ